jgi:hypothetical protein
MTDYERRSIHLVFDTNGQKSTPFVEIRIKFL